VLFVQDDVADMMIEMILGAMDQLKIGDPMNPATDVGPVIDEASRETLEVHAARMTREAKLLRQTPALGRISNPGCSLRPMAFEIDAISQLEREDLRVRCFHIVRYSADSSTKCAQVINATGYGLTLGVHSRIESTRSSSARGCMPEMSTFNRNQIGAVVACSRSAAKACRAPGRKRADRIICCASRWNAPIPKTRQHQAATRRC